MHGSQQLGEVRELPRRPPGVRAARSDARQIERRALGEDAAHGKHLDALARPRHQETLGARHRREVTDTAEHGLARPVEIGIEHADPVSALRQDGGELTSQRALADAALARTDRHDMANVRHPASDAVLDLGDLLGDARAAIADDL